jgi:hemin uptake protein HemP
MTTGGGAPGPDGASEKAGAPPARRAVASGDLFQGLRELVILHRNDEYRLRITRAGKLILTK